VSTLPTPPETPAVWNWYRVYAGLSAAMYLALMFGSFLFPLLVRPGRDEPPPWIFALLFGCISAPFAAAYIAAFFLPRRPWVWIYHIVLIGVGMTSACCIPACIPLLIYWLKPETRRYFGRE